MIPEGWTKHRLADLVQRDRKICYGIVQPGAFDPNGVILVRGRDYSFGWSPVEEFFRVSAEIDRPYRRSKLKADDLLLTIVGAGTGNVTTVPAWLDGANITQTTARIAVDQDRFDHRFVRALLESPSGKLAVYRALKGGAQPGLNIADIEGFEFAFPNPEMQRRIADILSTWDRALETVEALIANARKQKTALMQALLTGRTRLPGFEGAWAPITIGAVCDQVTERAGAATDLPVLSCSKHDGFVESLKYFKKKVFGDDLTGYKVVRRGMIGFPTNHVEEGSIARQDIVDAGLVSPIYCVFQPRDVDGEFLIRLLKTDTFTQRFAAATNASVNRRGSLRWKEFSKLHFDLPPPEEQRAIAAVINDTEAKGRALTAQRDALREEKSALMQQLLTGKRRVRVTESEAA